MVRGRGIAVTAVALMYQCALITRMARGRGTACPNACHAAVYRLTSRAFIGLPWPKNAAGITCPGGVAACAMSPPDGRSGWVTPTRAAGDRQVGDLPGRRIPVDHRSRRP